MAIPIASWDSTRLQISLSEQAIPSDFSGLSGVCPVLHIGHSQNQQKALLPGTDLTSQPGVFLCPRPVQTGSNSLLLIKANVNFQSESTAESETQRKVLFSLLAISAVVCIEDSEAAVVLEPVQELHRRVQERMEGSGAKLVRIVHGDLADSGSPLSLPELCSWTQLQAFLSEEQLRLRFESSMQLIKSATHCENDMQALISLLISLLRFASFPLSFPQFLVHTASWQSVDFSSTLASLQKAAEQMALLTPSAVQPILVKTSETISLSPTTLHELRQQYQLASPVVVLTVLGLPHLGTRQLLNSLVRSSAGCDLPDVYTQIASPTVLVQPLKLGTWQLLLVDASSLCDSRVSFVQDWMLAAVLVITSVPALILDETEDSLRLVEGVVEKISYWNQALGFSTERIHLMVHDLDANPWALKTAACLNRQYFAGSEVVVVISASFQCLDTPFASQLLSTSHFPKRNYSGSTSVLSNLLDSASFLLLSESPYGPLEPAYASLASQLLSSAQEELQVVFQMTQPGDEHCHLEVLFNEMFRRNVGSFLTCPPHPFLQSHLHASITAIVNQYRLRLAQVENCHRYTAHMSAAKMNSLVAKVLDYLYKEAWVVNKFMERAKELKVRLVDMRNRYREDGDKVEEVLGELKSKKKSLRNWFIANYAATAAATLASGGLKFAAKGVSVAFTASSVGNVLTGSRTEVFEVGAYGIGLTPSVCGSAFQLFQFQKAGGTLAKAKSFFSRTPQREHLRTTSDLQASLGALDRSAPMVVLLALGGKSTCASQVLNEVVQCMCPFTSSCVQPFQRGKNSHCLFFSFYQHGQVRTGSEPCQGVIIYMQTTEKAESRKDRMSVAFAAALLPVVSTVYLFLSVENQQVNGVLDRLPTGKLPKLTVVTLGEVKRPVLLGSYRGVYELRRVEKPGEAEIQSLAVKVKSDMDRSEVVEKRDFETGISTALESANSLD